MPSGLRSPSSDSRATPPSRALSRARFSSPRASPSYAAPPSRAAADPVMYRVPRAAGDAPSRRSRNLAPAPSPRLAGGAAAAFQRPAGVAHASSGSLAGHAAAHVALPAVVSPAMLARPASLPPPPPVSTGDEESEFQFDSDSFSQYAAGLGDSEALGDSFSQDMSNAEQLPEDDGLNGGMQSGYFTHLLVNNVEASHMAPPTTDPVSNEASEAAKNSQGRTRNFSIEEDTLLVSSWLNIGMDPIHGVDQSQGTYWARIYDYFHANKDFESTRTEVSLLNRWGTIQHDVNTFCGCIKRIQDRNRSGARVEDKIAGACAMFKAEDKKHRKFTLMHCWNILKDQPKWMEKLKEIDVAQKPSNKKQKTKSGSSPASVAPDVGGSNAQALVRPEGRKKEKQKLRQGRTMEAVEYLMSKKKEGDHEKEMKKQERCNTAFGLQQERLKLQKEMFEYQKRQDEKAEEERILGLDLTTMNDKQKQYYEERQNEIIARRNKII